MSDAVISDRRRMLANWLMSPQLDEDEALSVVANHPAMLAASTPVGGWEEPVAWRYPVLTARDEAVARMARAMRNGKAWPAVFQANTAEALAEDALAALEALAVIPTEGGGRD